MVRAPYAAALNGIVLRAVGGFALVPALTTVRCPSSWTTRSLAPCTCSLADQRSKESPPAVSGRVSAGEEGAPLLGSGVCPGMGTQPPGKPNI